MFAPVSLLVGQGGGRWLEETAGAGTEASPALLEANAGGSGGWVVARLFVAHPIAIPPSSLC